MTLDQALYEMELVGHDFYLYVNKESERPAVVYRRKGYDYGVISLIWAPDSGPPRHSCPRGRGLREACACHDARVANGNEPVRVLVVDDHELFRRGLTMLLGVEEGIEVVGEASDGAEGTELAVSTAPDVVLLDVRMPKQSGIEACVAIKAASPTTKIVMLTVSDEEADLPGRQERRLRIPA